MSTRTPGLQVRSRYHAYWGQYATFTSASVGTLPNQSGNVLSAAEFPKLEAGDTGYVTTTNPGLYFCTSVGTLGGGDAVWERTGSTSTVVDRFAPTIVVGNVLAGDPVAAQAAPFEYYGDPGDGTGIQAALVSAAAIPSGAWVHIRRGVYTLAAAALPLAIPAWTKVTGDGSATALAGRADDRRVFTMTGSSIELADLWIDMPAPTAGATGTAVINALASTDSRITGLFVEGGVDLDADESLDAVIESGGSLAVENVQVTFARFGANGQIAIVRVSGVGSNTRVSGCNLEGGDWCVLVENGPAPTGVTIHDNKLQTAGVACVDVRSSVSATAVRDNYLVATGDAIDLVWDGSGIIMGNTTIGGMLIELRSNSSNTICIGNQATVTDDGSTNEVAHNIPL